jgi:hypothetical protein
MIRPYAKDETDMYALKNGLYLGEPIESVPGRGNLPKVLSFVKKTLFVIRKNL